MPWTALVFNFLLTLEMREGECATVHMVYKNCTYGWKWQNIDKSLNNTDPHPRSPQALQLAHSSLVWNSRLQVSYFTGRMDNNLRALLKKISFCVSFSGMLRKTSSKDGSWYDRKVSHCWDYWDHSWDWMWRSVYWCFQIYWYTDAVNLLMLSHAIPAQFLSGSSRRESTKYLYLCICLFVFLCICAILPWCLSGLS